MSLKYDFTNGDGATFETVNPARPQETVGRYSWTGDLGFPGPAVAPDLSLIHI